LDAFLTADSDSPEAGFDALEAVLAAAD
jgi:hypothetical protein